MALIRRFGWVFGVAGALLVLAGLSGGYALGWDPQTTGLRVAVGVALLLVWPAVEHERVAQLASTRGFALSSGSAALQVVALLLAVTFYVVVDERLDRTWDLTRRGSNSLSNHTLQVLASVDEPIEILAFFEKNAPEGYHFGRLAQRYAEASDQVHYRPIDPLAEPLRAEQHEVTGPTVILRRGERTERLQFDFIEANLTRRLVTLLAEREHTVCWSGGHGEADPDDDVSPEGYGAIVLALEATNFQVRPAVIATEGVDRGCDALVIARPARDWLPAEREALAAYLAEGGQALVLVDPRFHTPGFLADLERFGVRVHDDVVFDDDRRGMVAGMAGTLAIWGERIVSHPATQGLTASVLLPVTRSLERVPVEGLRSRDLLRTSQLAWGETDLENEDIRPDEGLDRIGQLAVGVEVTIDDPSALAVAPGSPGAPVATDGTPSVGQLVPTDLEPQPGGRLVVIGDADFPSNQAMTLGNNQDLFLNLIAWMVGEEEQLGERPTEVDALDITELGSAMLCLVSLVFVPGGAVALALLTFLRRRRL